VVEGSVEATSRSANLREQEETLSRSRPLHAVAKQRLRDRDDTVIFIDDFHYIPPETQLDIIKGVKQLVFDGLRIILASVPHRAFDAVRVEKEMTGRVSSSRSRFGGSKTSRSSPRAASARSTRRSQRGICGGSQRRPTRART